MKSNLFLIIANLLSIGSCKQPNQMAQDESILIEDLQSHEVNLIDEDLSTIPPSNFVSAPKMEGIKEIDPQNPPVVLDILKARNNLREITVEYIGKNIRYIPIRFPTPPDSLWNSIEDFDFLITPNNIVAYHHTYGISQFDLYGNFISQIIKNEFYYTWVPQYNVPVITQEDMANFDGSKGIIHAIGDHIYYQYHLANKGQVWMMDYDASPGSLSGQISEATIENNSGNIRGEKQFTFKNENKVAVATSQFGAINIFPMNEEEWISMPEKMSRDNNDYSLSIANAAGDTLSTFRDFDPVNHFKGSAYRGIDIGGQYFYNGRQHVRQAFNDTIYVVDAINKLLPKYIIDFGELGIKSTIEGMDPHFSLENKFILHQFLESDKYLFIVYTKNNVSPNSAKKGTLEFNACIYDKDNKDLFHVYMDEDPYYLGRGWPKSPIDFIINSKGLPFWPKNVTQNGIAFTWFKGLDIKMKRYPNFAENEIMSIFNDEMRDDDYLLMIVY